jgi:hypothetical protein
MEQQKFSSHKISIENFKYLIFGIGALPVVVIYSFLRIHYKLTSAWLFILCITIAFLCGHYLWFFFKKFSDNRLETLNFLNKALSEHIVTIPNTSIIPNGWIFERMVIDSQDISQFKELKDIIEPKVNTYLYYKQFNATSATYGSIIKGLYSPNLDKIFMASTKINQVIPEINNRRGEKINLCCMAHNTIN